MVSIASHFRQRKFYRSWYDWGLCKYSLLLFRSKWRLPLRNRIAKVALSGERYPFFLRLGSTDALVLEEIFIARHYDFGLCGDEDCKRFIVDLGANIGVSLRFWDQMFPGARMIAVEPDEDNVRICGMNLSAAGLKDRVRVIQAFVGGTPREAYLSRGHGEWGYAITDSNKFNEHSVTVLTMNQILEGEAGEVDLLKCDIEGAERELFRDASAWVHRIRNIIIELHPPYSIEELESDLAVAGVTFEAKPAQKSVWWLRRLSR